ncbi:hypothetical protein [Treponema pedis]
MKANSLKFFIVMIFVVFFASCNNSFNVPDVKELDDGVVRSSTVTD